MTRTVRVLDAILRALDVALFVWCAIVLVTALRSCEPAPAYADTPAPLHLRTREPTRLCAFTREGEPERCRELPAGRFLAEPGWLALDAEMRRLQDAEVKLGAENVSLRKSATAWRPGWKTITGAVLVGVALGVAATR